MPDLPRFRTAAATDVGRVRSVNEDSYLILPRLAFVADGMGGHASGDVASATTAHTLAALDGNGPLAPQDLLTAVDRANAAIVSEGMAHPEKAGMGTTLAGLALVQHEGGWYWLLVNVGDSRVYRLSAGTAKQLTVDHSEVAEMVAAGTISAEEARTHPLRNVVTRALGTVPAPVADSWLIPIDDSDLFLVCSDGLTGEVDDARIGELAAQTLPGQVANIPQSGLQLLADRLVAEAVEAGGRDNVTVVIVAAPRDLTNDRLESTSTLPKAELPELPESSGAPGAPGSTS